MPLIKIETNQEVSLPARQGFLEKASAFTANLFGKTEQFVMVTLEPGKSMMFGAGTGPTAHVSIIRIGLEVNRCPDYTKAICAFLDEELGVPPERVFVGFENIDGKQLGWNSKTFA
ncbi:MAG: hypothetical protein JEZ02_02135 [Desulfatibacillum sp.]|nr:hypothetical protein [Desulfatibacillum sp.]